MAELRFEEEKPQQKKGGKSKEGEGEGDDNFGLADEDWDAYRNISKEQFEEEDEEDQNGLNELEEQIAEMDPEFPLMLMGKKVATAEDF